MILLDAIEFLQKELINYLSQKLRMTPEVYAEIGNLAFANDPGNSNNNNLNNTVVISLVNVEEDRVSKKPDNVYRSPSGVTYKNPEIHLNLYILFSANKTGYGTALENLSYIIQFFQYNNVFSADNFPEFPLNIEKLIPDMVSLNFEQLNQLWSFLGGKQVPSVMYKFRMVVIDEGTKQSEGTMIKEIVTEAKNIRNR